MLNVLRNLDWSIVITALISVIPSLICITLHETAHGYVAYRLGDDTAKKMGRLTLNPLKHIDIFGLVMMAVFHFGWAKAVPVNMFRFKNPKTGMAITAAAGPICNILLACVFLAVYGLTFEALGSSQFGQFFLEIFYLTAYISIALAIFNVIPIPPLDGSKVLFSLLSDRSYYKLMRYEKYGMIALVIIVYVSSKTGIFGDPLGTAAGWLFEKLFVIAEASHSLTV